MGNKRRGRERLERCVSCGRAVPRDKAVDDVKRTHYTTDLKAENVTYTDFRDVYYCVSCAKHRGIFEKKKQQAQRKREREAYGDIF
jgi:ribosomal protein S26